ncbi:uncharacterized protein BDV17DRAFT_264419 [Aspergillus undulatus]|uniref:uncharacterized protein n=1 Tax=Aspergillus undulatus TaxID=1810928 RepID=UPI003CCD492B
MNMSPNAYNVRFRKIPCRYSAAGLVTLTATAAVIHYFPKPSSIGCKLLMISCASNLPTHRCSWADARLGAAGVAILPAASQCTVDTVL